MLPFGSGQLGSQLSCSSTLKLSVLESGLLKKITRESVPLIVVPAVCAISHTLYSPPALGVSRNGINCTGVEPLAELNVPGAWRQPLGYDGEAAGPATTPPTTWSW